MDASPLSTRPTWIDVQALMTSLPVLESTIEAEFKRIPTGAAFPTSVASSAGSSKKNRWKEFVPYDHNRVMLCSDDNYTALNDERDYINASFIRGFSSNDGYIAAQAPMLGTVDDFWRMLWSENCRVVVMMSRTMEGYQTRGYKYWPDAGESLEAGDLVITTQREEERSTHAIRKIVLCDAKTCETRTVTQLQFLCWPEESNCLPCIPTFLGFWNVFRKIHKDDTRLPIIHCSNGSQRSTLFIALDILCHQMTLIGKMDTFNTVRRLREDRAWSVNSLDQYIFLHYCLLEVCFDFCPSLVAMHVPTKHGSHGNAEKVTASRTYSVDVFKNIQLSRFANSGRSRENRPGSNMAPALEEAEPAEEAEETSTTTTAGAATTATATTAISSLAAALAKTAKTTAAATTSVPYTSSGSAIADKPNLRCRMASSQRRQWISSRHRLEKVFSSTDVGSGMKSTYLRSDGEIREEFKVLSSHRALWNRISRSSDFFSQSDIESKILEEKNGNVYRGSSKVWIPVENDSVPVICVPMNRTFVTATTISETTPSRLKHSLSLQDTKVLAEISGILPAENKKSFLVTSFMHLMSSEFWQVLFDTGCQTVIRILPGKKNKKMSDFPTVETDDFNVSVESVSNLRPEITEAVFIMKPNDYANTTQSRYSQADEQTIKILTLTGLSVYGQSETCDLLLYLFQFLDTWLNQTFTSLVNVQCSDGVSNCGFFCAAHNVVSNLKGGDEADVYLTCRIIQNMIPDAISQEQYAHLYRLCDQHMMNSLTRDLPDSHPYMKEKRRRSQQLDHSSSLESSSSTD